MSTTSRFTERDVSEFFDQTTQTYLSFWDSEGVLHTGYFTGEDDSDYHAAADRTSDILAADAGIDASANVLDVGCGCGNFLLRLAERTGCRGEGLDLSIERVRFAEQRRAERGASLPVSFRHGSATDLPYDDGTFTHVVSQDALFLVPDKPRSHAEMFRVLAPGGVLAVSDFLQPTERIGEAARRHVYDRVRWNDGYSLDGYRRALAEVGFVDVVARSLDAHIRQTYRVLGRTARQRAETTADEAARTWILGFADSCDEIQAAIDRGEFGWGMFVARKPA
ncbi:MULTISPECIES: class I SAM-dependent methyltransferase [unclassified Micromonospora]|uniref:class I SAM-dependent methyltransferase n=1 Tax=unclassified Micromonospora TaxID=2617518 RepID=UPI001C24E0AD|nr:MULTISPECIES: class I SAM-dependent methyltransferase [unclassified Micromonospora]MBU8860496.1 methyltransferase domain-containing protein [Micromonospora sp. WMMB482]MDM4780033.1 methyltransferase domain-containing protein [Micromonospora sp. b486]